MPFSSSADATLYVDMAYLWPFEASWSFSENCFMLHETLTKLGCFYTGNTFWGDLKSWAHILLWNGADDHSTYLPNLHINKLNYAWTDIKINQ